MKRLSLVGWCLVLSVRLLAVEQPLPRSSPESQGVDSAGLLTFVEALESEVDAVHSIMLVRHGQVLAEGWWGPYAAEDWHVLYSVTKSFTSTAVGFAQQEGLLDITDHVLDYFPESAPTEPAGGMAQMRIRDLLTMATGHEDDTMPRLRESPDDGWVKTFLATEVEHRPGIHFRYNSGASHVLAALVQTVSGETVAEFLRPRLFEPLEIGEVLWGSSPGGVNLGAGGLNLRTEDLAKFGQLFLQQGRWGREQLLDASWIEAASARQVSSGGDPGSNWDAGYGYQFWRNKVSGYRADGAQGQFVFVLPEYDVVLAVTSGTGNTNGVMEMVWQHLLPALRYVVLPENDTARTELEAKLASLTLALPTGAPASPRSEQVSGVRYELEENEQGLTAVTVDFSTASPLIEFEDASGRHAITCGVGEWLRGRTGFRERISMLWNVAEQGIAASAAWSDEDTFVAKLCFTDTPYTITATFKFTGDELTLDMVHNQRWGDPVRPTVVGRR